MSANEHGAEATLHELRSVKKQMPSISRCKHRRIIALFGDYARMTPIEEIASQLEAAWGGQTLAMLREEATHQMNGTVFQALRAAPGPRRVLAACITGEHELRKLGQIPKDGAQAFGDWSRVSMFEAAARAFMAGGFVYDFDNSSRSSARPIVLIAADPDSITRLESVLGLQP